MKRNSRGFTLIELLVVIAIIALLMGLLLPALAKALGNARVRTDQGELKGIVESFSIYAETDKKRQFPIPGRINRMAVDSFSDGADYNGIMNGAQVQGVGDVDDTINITAWLHSFMIGANYYGTQILISSSEKSSMVVAKGDEGANSEEEAYDYSRVDVANDQYWDHEFSADIEGTGKSTAPEGPDAEEGGVADVCHVSYANLALCGTRLKDWKDGSSNTVILSSRGPELQNATDINSDFFTLSPTLELYGPTEFWEGIYVGGDCSAHYVKDMWFNNKEYTTKNTWKMYKDNCFMAEFSDFENTDPLGNDGGASGDNWMVINVESSVSDVVAVHDLLPGETP